ncbi:MAG: sigma-70 family RNA polymerase sigma factor [Vicinamibacterales bacterium]
MTLSSSDVTGLLLRWSKGDERALDRLLPLIYAELRRIASQQLRNERRDHTLAPTAVVHELYLRLVDQRRSTWENRAHFFGLAAQLMRRILVDHARARHAGKRGGSVTRLSLEEALDESHDDPGAPGAAQSAADVLEIDLALERLSKVDPDQARIVELRFFAGLTVEETAHILKRSPRTVKREWRLARAWLYRELRP